MKNALRVGIALVSIGAGMGMAAGTPTSRPVVGHFEASVVPPGEGHCPPVPGVLCTSGRVRGGHPGDLPVRHDGRQLLGRTGATGQVGLRGDFDAAAGTTKGDYIGELCKP